MMRMGAMAVGLGCLAISPQVVNATTFKFVSNLQSQSFTVSKYLDPTGNGDVDLKFRVEKAGPVVMTFMGGCFIQGNPGAVSRVTIYVKLQGRDTFQGLPPTYLGNTFCSTNNTTRGDVTGFTMGGMDMPRGNHSVKVFATAANGASVFLSSTALHIED